MFSDAFGGYEPLPRGTIVVVVDDARAEDGGRVRAGTQARVVEAWTQADGDAPVRLETLTGVALVARREHLVLQRGGATPARSEDDRARAWARVEGHVQLETLVGSRAWNLNVAGSDEDRRGFYLAPFELLADLEPPPAQVDHGADTQLARSASRGDPRPGPASTDPASDEEAAGRTGEREHGRSERFARSASRDDPRPTPSRTDGVPDVRASGRLGEREHERSEGLVWELARFLRLLLDSDPNALEALYGPVLRATPFGERVVAARDAFLSRQAQGTFGRYALAQLERLQSRERRSRAMEAAAHLWRAEPGLADHDVVDRLAAVAVEHGAEAKQARAAARDALRSLTRSLHDRGRIADRDPATVRAFLTGLAPDATPEGWLDARADRPKNAMHLLRLLHSGVSILEGHGPLIRVPEGPLRSRLLAVRSGHVPLDEVVREARDVARRLEQVAASSTLPAAPDEPVARALLRAGRRRAHAASFAEVVAGPGSVWPVLDRDPGHGVPSPVLHRFLAARPERALVVAVSGAHAYGFPSPDSDVDAKGVHVAPTARVVGLGGVKETASHLGFVDGVEVDYTSHELGKACRMLLEGDGNVLEWVLGRLVLREHPRMPELRELARRNLHRGSFRHYAGFSRTLLREYERGKAEHGQGRVKPLLYVFRTALTGVHLLRAGELEPDLTALVDRYPAFAAVRELVARKRAGPEQGALPDDAGLLALVARAHRDLEEAHAASSLPDGPPAAAALSAWVADLRLSEG